MKEYGIAVLLGLALASLGLLQGCFLALVAGAGGAAAYGTAKYAGNTLEVDQAASLDKAWETANAALAELKMPAAASKKDEAYGRLEAGNARGQLVSVELQRKSDRVTRVRITVGTFDSTDNRAAARQIYDKMEALGGAGLPAGKPGSDPPP
jgi:hypothetical protein